MISSSFYFLLIFLAFWPLGSRGTTPMDLTLTSTSTVAPTPVPSTIGVIETTQTTSTQKEPTPSTAKLVEPKEMMECYILNNEDLNCDCHGGPFNNQSLYESLSSKGAFYWEKFQSDRQRLQKIQLTNCTITNTTREITDRIYHLRELIFIDCLNLPEYLFKIMDRIFGREALPKMVYTDPVANLKIHYTVNEPRDTWPSHFTLLPPKGDSSSFIDKDYNLNKLELRNMKNMKDFDPRMFEHFPYLRYLDISNNNFGDKFPNITQWSGLRYLKCENCGLSEIPRKDEIPGDLDVLDLSNNRIKYTNFFNKSTNSFDENYFLHQSQLSLLDLSYNQLQYIQTDTFKNVKFKTSYVYDYYNGAIVIDMSNNKLTTAPYHIIQDISKNRPNKNSVIFIGEDNPFNCHCDMLNIKTVVVEVGHFNFFGICETPFYLEDRSVMHLNHDMYELKTCPELPQEEEGQEKHQSGWSVFGEVFLGFFLVVLISVFLFLAYTYLQGVRKSRQENITTHYRHLRMQQDATTLPCDRADDPDVFTIEDTNANSFANDHNNY